MKTLFKSTGRLLACAAVTAALSVAAEAQDLKPINVLIPNENTTTLYPNIVARELGFFEQEGLDVTLLASDTTIPYVAFLVNGQADLVMLDSAQMFQAVNTQQPVKMIFEGMQYAPEVVMVREESDIKSIADLVGKTVGLASDRDQITVQIALDTAGITIDQVSTVVVGDSGPVLAKSVRDNDVDAVSAAANDLTVLQANGIKMRDITPAKVSENPANSFVIATDRMEELRPVVTAYLRAWAMGAEAAKIDREAVAAMCRKSIPEEWESEEGGQALLDASMKMILPQTPKHGQPQPDVWKAIQGPYMKYGIIDAEIDPATFIDNSFFEEANNIDADAIKAAIEKWKAENPDYLKQ
jgi:NitT/TauT family transport system substrate-binding protein